MISLTYFKCLDDRLFKASESTVDNLRKSKKNDSEDDNQLNLSCCILMLDILLRQVSPLKISSYKKFLDKFEFYLTYFVRQKCRPWEQALTFLGYNNTHTIDTAFVYLPL